MFPYGSGPDGQIRPRPAGVKNHRAYLGGLFEHVVNLMEVVFRVSPCYPQVDRNLLLIGASCTIWARSTSSATRRT